ncbi:hypothetical protein [Streptomyces buecherae]|uniref:hypothetical protein n=1 Tax=Streptomyces buecherae TaxID=2763006 RepID=UPI0037B66C4F
MSAHDGRKNVNLSFVGRRPAFPYRTTAGTDQVKSRDEENLGTLKEEPPYAAMTQHHIMPWKAIKDAWARTISSFYCDDDTPIPRYLQKFLTFLENEVQALDFEPALRNGGKEVKDLLRALRQKTVYHDEGGPYFKEEVEVLRQMMCWSSGNLIVGPGSPGKGYSYGTSTKYAFRVDDPSDEMEPDLGERALDPLLRREFKSVRTAVKAISAGAVGLDHLSQFYQSMQVLSSHRTRKLPQAVRDSDWRKINPDELFVPSVGSNLMTGPAKSRAIFGRLKNNSGRILREVTGRATGQEAALPDIGSATVPTLDGSITIDGTKITLDVVSEDAFHVRRRGTATGIRVDALLKWAADRWGQSPEVPPFVRGLELRRLTVTAEGVRGGEIWQFAIATRTDLAGVATETVLYLEYVKGKGFSLGALVACRDTADQESPPLYFCGDFSKAGADWQLRASGGPYDVDRLARALGIALSELPAEVAALVPRSVAVEIRCSFTSTGGAMTVAATVGRLHVAIASLSG